MQGSGLEENNLLSNKPLSATHEDRQADPEDQAGFEFEIHGSSG